MSGETDTDFVGYGTPVEQIDGDGSLSKLANENKLKAQKVRDKQGRERFHGAFTGGYSAGYYNTVGTAEGWTPSTFTSRRKKIDDASSNVHGQSGRPEDYMDEEDLEAFGIAPRQIQTTDTFRKDIGDNERAAWDPVVPGLNKAITDAIKPVHFTAAIKLLRLMGWKQGQGIGPRIKRKRADKKSNQRVMGPALPTTADMAAGSSESDSDEFVNNLTFAPKDMNPVDFAAKDDLHGIGYTSLAAGRKPKSSAVEEERLTFGGHRKGISGQAFGVGIEEEDEDGDIYGKEVMSNYDMTLSDEPTDLHTFTKPSDKHSQSSKIYQSARILEGFCLAQKNDGAKESYTVPELPRGYRPCAAVTGVSQLPKLYGKLDKTLRGLIIGEAGQGVPPVSDKQESKQVEPLCQGHKTPTNLNEAKPSDNQQYVEDEVPLPPMRSTEPLNKQSVDFKPFAKNPEKQARYERYLLLKRSGDRDAYGKVAPADYRQRDKAREREEFERSGKFFKDLSGVMASRFTRSKQTDEEDDSKVSVRVDEEAEDLLDDKKEAVRMSMFGKLTRETYEWHPHRLLCKRFNIPDPYPDSQLVGLPTVYKDKISAYNFLDLESLTTAPEERRQHENIKLTEKPDESKGLEEVPSGPKTLPLGEKAPVDLFKAVFQDSSSDSSESETDDESKIEADAGTNHDAQIESNTKLLQLQDKYSQSRDVASVYENPKDPVVDTQSESMQVKKVKFVPKKDRYKERKTRWSNADSSVDDASPAVDSTIQTSQIHCADQGDQGAALDGSTSLLALENVVQPENMLDPNDAEIPRSPGTPDSEDCWMPALPPTPIDGTQTACSLSHNVKKKRKAKHKHKKDSKKKTRKKERRKR
ncbi:G patch domain-containing protein 1-like [Watersipora subatra]|uniref:G patch domain-containing protein 1-like n=1 Tax=Watersipora subatra TaxID=2589382 RepID=UPI00355BD519